MPRNSLAGMGLHVLPAALPALLGMWVCGQPSSGSEFVLPPLHAAPTRKCLWCVGAVSPSLQVSNNSRNASQEARTKEGKHGVFSMARDRLSLLCPS